MVLNAHGRWRTVVLKGPEEEARAQLDALLASSPTFGPSPFDLTGNVHYIALDVDADDPSLIRHILRLLPRGAHPWLSWSGRRGFHVWLFLREAVPFERVLPFLEALSERLRGAPVELFPNVNGTPTRCLKWPGTLHPETGAPEVFVPRQRPSDLNAVDTALALMALRDGLGRTPVALLEPARLCRDRLVVTNALPPGSSSHSPPTVLDLLHADEALVRFLAKELQTEFKGHGKAVRCPLHPPDRHPSASWYFAPGRGWVLCCHHTGRSFSLPELVHWRETSCLASLRGRPRKDALLRLAHKSGRLLEVTQEVAQIGSQTLLSLSQRAANRSSQDTGGDLERICWRPLEEEKPDPIKVWQVLVQHALASASQGRAAFLAPVRKVAEEARVSLERACRAINWLAALGLVGKARGWFVDDSGRRRAQVLVLCKPDPKEVRKRFRRLGGWPSRRFNRALVARALGEGVAASVFRRCPGEDVGALVATNALATVTTTG
ncbi:MAG: hypothetical protein ABDI20_09650 [Candidatus Bipolaricaulaceae bacterium]